MVFESRSTQTSAVWLWRSWADTVVMRQSSCNSKTTKKFFIITALAKQLQGSGLFTNWHDCLPNLEIPLDGGFVVLSFYRSHCGYTIFIAREAQQPEAFFSLFGSRSYGFQKFITMG